MFLLPQKGHIEAFCYKKKDDEAKKASENREERSEQAEVVLTCLECEDEETTYEEVSEYWRFQD